MKRNCVLLANFSLLNNYIAYLWYYVRQNIIPLKGRDIEVNYVTLILQDNTFK